MENKGQRKLNVELGEKEAEGTYANIVLISHSPSEFIIDFARILPGAPKAKIHSRIIMTPPNAKGLLDTLQKNITLFEEKHGQVKMAGQANDQSGIGFKSTD